MISKVNPRTYVDNVIRSKKFEDFELLLLNIGSLAPSTHNTQPWLLEKSRGSVIVYPDYEMQVPHADPHNKYLFISIGAFIGNIIEFLEAIHCHVHVTYDSRTQSTKLTFHRPKSNELSQAAITSLKLIGSRQNFRGFYNTPTKKDISTIKSVISAYEGLSLTSDTQDILKLSNLTAQGVQKAYGNKDFRQEISSLINHNKSRKKIGLHGYSLRLKQVQSIIVPKVMRYRDIGEKLGSLNKKSFDTSHAVSVYSLFSKKNNIEGWIEAGLYTERAMLALQKKGYATSIYVASLEAGDSLKEVKRIMDTGDKIPVILFTIGTAPDILPHSARLSVAEKMKI